MSSSKERPLLERRYLDKAEEIAERFPLFVDDCRVLISKTRKKDAAEQPARTVRTMIASGRASWIESLAILFREIDLNTELYIRIYQTINTRNVDKAIRLLKELQIAADSESREYRYSFYLKPKSSMVKALMNPKCARSKFFLFDCDLKDKAVVEHLRASLATITEIVQIYETKNGYHFITKPFDPARIALPEKVELKRDAMMLLHYEN